MSTARVTALSAAPAAPGSTLRVTALQADAVDIQSTARVTRLEVAASGASKVRVTRLSVSQSTTLKWIMRAIGLVPLSRAVGDPTPPPATWGPFGNLGAYQPWWNSSGAPATIGWTPPSEAGMGDFTPTGYPATGLTRVDGNQTITVPGTIIEDKEIFGNVDVRTTDVIIRRCVIHGPQSAPTSATGCVRFENAAVRRGLVEDCTIFPNAPHYFVDGVRGHDFTARRCNIFGTTDGFGVMNTSAPSSAYNVAIEGCFVWGHAYRATPSSVQSDLHTHNDGTQVHGGNTITFEGNNFQSFCAPAFSDIPIPYRTDTAALPFTGWGQATGQTIGLLPIIGQVGNVTIKNNWLSGGGEGNIHADVRTFPVPASLGTFTGNKFDGTNRTGSPRYTIRLSDHTLIFTDGGGNVYQNAKFGQVDGTPVTVRYDA